jgi:hypothetical protein
MLNALFTELIRTGKHPYDFLAELTPDTQQTLLGICWGVPAYKEYISQKYNYFAMREEFKSVFINDFMKFMKGYYASLIGGEDEKIKQAGSVAAYLAKHRLANPLLPTTNTYPYVLLINHLKQIFAGSKEIKNLLNTATGYLHRRVLAGQWLVLLLRSGLKGPEQGDVTAVNAANKIINDLRLDNDDFLAIAKSAELDQGMRKLLFNKTLIFALLITQLEAIHAIISQPTFEFDSSDVAQTHALFIALGNNHLPVVEKFLDNGFSIDAEYDCFPYKGTLFSFAIASGEVKPEVLQFFIARGIDVNKKVKTLDSKYAQPLACLLSTNRIEPAIVLLKAGAILARDSYKSALAPCQFTLGQIDDILASPTLHKDTPRYLFLLKKALATNDRPLIRRILQEQRITAEFAYSTTVYGQKVLGESLAIMLLKCGVNFKSAEISAFCYSNDDLQAILRADELNAEVLGAVALSIEHNNQQAEMALAFRRKATTHRAPLPTALFEPATATTALQASAAIFAGVFTPEVRDPAVNVTLPSSKVARSL